MSEALQSGNTTTISTASQSLNSNVAATSALVDNLQAVGSSLPTQGLIDNTHPNILLLLLLLLHPPQTINLLILLYILLNKKTWINQLTLIQSSHYNNNNSNNSIPNL